ncbi:MAG: hypothetical protein ACLQNE_05230, partial [Thermoguttaceae bacterium]
PACHALADLAGDLLAPVCQLLERRGSLDHRTRRWGSGAFAKVALPNYSRPGNHVPQCAMLTRSASEGNS